jgi:hypothetical protein
MFDITDGMEVERESDPPASAPGPQSEPSGEKQFRIQIRAIFPDPKTRDVILLTFLKVGVKNKQKVGIGGASEMCKSKGRIWI